MVSEIESAISVLAQFSALEAPQRSVDRREICAHALLSALVHHWPEKSTPLLERLLAATSQIKVHEHSRWMTQRRIAIARLSRDGVTLALL
jgi:hypothetical protein